MHDGSCAIRVGWVVKMIQFFDNELKRWLLATCCFQVVASGPSRESNKSSTTLSTTLSTTFRASFQSCWQAIKSCWSKQFIPKWAILGWIVFINNFFQFVNNLPVFSISVINRPKFDYQSDGGHLKTRCTAKSPTSHQHQTLQMN